METILLSIIAFISTNIDDLFINMFFFAQHPTKRDAHNITAGKYLGMGTLTAISILGGFGLQMLPEQYLSLLGLIPIALGVKEIIVSLRIQDSSDDTHDVNKILWLSVMIITIANGADNIGVYLPLFASFALWQMMTAIIIFALMTGLWCSLSRRLAHMPVLQKLLTKYKPVLVPLVYILLGFYILFL